MQNVKNWKELFVNLDVCDGQLEVNGVVFVKDTHSNGFQIAIWLSISVEISIFVRKLLSFWNSWFSIRKSSNSYHSIDKSSSLCQKQIGWFIGLVL